MIVQQMNFWQKIDRVLNISRLIHLTWCLTAITIAYGQTPKDSADQYYSDGLYEQALPFFHQAYQTLTIVENWDTLSRLD